MNIGSFNNQNIVWEELAADELKKISAKEDSKVVIAALNCLLKGEALNESLPSDLKQRISNLKEIMDNPDMYAEEKNYKAFQNIIGKRIREEIDYLNGLSQEDRAKRIEYQEQKEKKRKELKEQIEGIKHQVKQ